MNAGNSTENRSRRMLALLLALAGAVLAGWGVYAFANPIVVLKWSTATELETAGYAVYRGPSADGPFDKISSEIIPASSNPLSGGDYEYTDREVEPGTTYYYMLEEIELSGTANREGPVVSEAVRRGLAEGALGAVLIVTGFVLARSSPREKEG